MIKCIQVATAILLLGASASAQNYKMLSLRAGAGISTTTFPNVATAVNGQNNSQGASSIFTYMAGVGLNVPLGGRVSVQPELTYIRKGYEISYTQGVVKASGKYYYDCVEVPLFIKVAFAQDRFRFFAFAGPSVSYIWGGSYSLEAVGGGNTISQAGKIKFAEGQSTASIQYFDTNTFRQVNVGVQGGIAAGTRLGTGMLLLELRGGLGLTDFSKDEESKFRTAMVALSYGFPLGSVSN